MPSQEYIANLLKALSKSEDLIAAHKELLREKTAQIEAQITRHRLDLEMMKYRNKQVPPQSTILPQLPQLPQTPTPQNRQRVQIDVHQPSTSNTGITEQLNNSLQIRNVNRSLDLPITCTSNTNTSTYNTTSTFNSSTTSNTSVVASTPSPLPAIRSDIRQNNHPS